MKTCCFTGPRTHKLNFPAGEKDDACIKLKSKISLEIERLYQRGFRKFLSGMADGVDTYCAEAVIELKKRFSDVSLVAVLPYNHKGAGRSEEEKNRFFEIINKADSVIVLREYYSKDCYYKRNEYMVDNSDLLFAIYSETGGTAYTIKYAAKKDKPIRICPKTPL